MLILTIDDCLFPRAFWKTTKYTEITAFHRNKIFNQKTSNLDFTDNIQIVKQLN